MRISEITSEGARRLKGSFAAAASLTGVVMLAGFCLQQGGLLCFHLLERAGVSRTLADRISVLGILTLTLMLLSPLRLGITFWYQRLDGSYHSPKTAFFCFTGFGRYCAALGFLLVRKGALFLAFLLPQLPAVFLTAVLRIAWSGGAPLGPLFAVLLLLLLLLAVLGFFLSLYVGMGFFLADYLYHGGRMKNPFRALKNSWQRMRGERSRLLLLFLRLLPYFLLCLLLAPLPFAAPNIRSALAVFAGERLHEAD